MERFQTILLVKRHRLRRNRKKEKQNTSLKNGAYFFVTLLLIVILAFPLTAGIIYTRISQDLPPVEWLELYLDAETGFFLSPTEILDRDEQTVLYQLGNYGIERRFLPIDPNEEEFFSPYLVQLTAASIEPDFWSSPGYQANWFKNDPPATIAEHLVTRLLLWQEDANWNTSLRMRLLAAQVTKRYGRSQIMEWFLNSSAYGHNTIGADSAARLYLNKPASELNLAEAALLVATAQKPAINPLDAPQAALENQKQFLDELYQKEIIGTEDYQKALETEVQINTPPLPFPQTARAFSQLVLNRLYREYGFERVELGGLRVISTLDLNKQNTLTCTTRLQIERLKGQPASTDNCPPANLLTTITSTQPKLPDTLQASALIMSPSTGEVLAYLGDDNGLQESGYTQRHQAASLLTPLITVNAFARGFNPASQVWDIPASLPLDLKSFQQPIETYQGPLRLRTAVINDRLAPLSQLYEQLGADIIWRTASSFGLSDQPLETPNEILFHHNTANLLEIAQLYNTFASLGTRYGVRSQETGVIEAVLYQRIETVDGQVLFTLTEPDSASIVSPQLAYLTHNILQDEYARRAAYGYPNLLEIGRPTGAKYGSNYEKNEVWSVGYTPEYTTVVWVGLPSDENNPTLDTKSAGAVWHAVMQWLHKGLPVTEWQTPVGISEAKVCTLSGKLPTRECPTTITETFIDGSQPVSYDTLFKTYAINRETGLLATVFTPPDLVEERVYMIFPENAVEWASAADIPKPPKNYDSIQAASPSDSVVITNPDAYQYVSGTISIRGTASGDNLQSFQLQSGAGLYPLTWLQVGEEQSVPKQNTRLATWDTTTLEDGLYALRLQVVRKNLQIENHTIQVTVDNTAPTITPLYPLEGSQISAQLNGQITLQADVQDQMGLQEVIWYVDGQRIGKQTQMPYSYPVRLQTGSHTLKITATDQAGNQNTSTEINFTVE